MRRIVLLVQLGSIVQEVRRLPHHVLLVRSTTWKELEVLYIAFLVHLGSIVEMSHRLPYYVLLGAIVQLVHRFPYHVLLVHSAI